MTPVTARMAAESAYVLSSMWVRKLPLQDVQLKNWQSANKTNKMFCSYLVKIYVSEYAPSTAKCDM